tara:strand:- start:687 stop:1076 length:390 start_codon:yes stop_codon:yes gene_type:complete
MNKNLLKSPRTIAVQMLYSYSINPDQKIIYNKNQFKKFIKDVVNGTIERKEFIDETIEKYLKDDINDIKTDKILKIIIQAAVYELLYVHKNNKKIIISEYLKTAENFVISSQLKFLNAILDKISKLIRK